MVTFAEPRRFVRNSGYQEQRELVMAGLDLQAIDAPLRGLIASFSRLPYCYTLQCCYGHFLHAAQTDPRNLEDLPAAGVGPVEYRIAYLALCIQASSSGGRLRRMLAAVPAMHPQYVQFSSPDWFWERHLNAYALQVEPERFKDRDVAIIDYPEALLLQDIRSHFFDQLRRIAQAGLEEQLSPG